MAKEGWRIWSHKSVILQVTRRKHAVAFSNGMEYFATCGGCTAAGAAGLAVMSVVASEGLQARWHMLHLMLGFRVCVLPVAPITPIWPLHA